MRPSPPTARRIKGTTSTSAASTPSLYGGGLQDMDPGPGTDVAQDLSGSRRRRHDVQWDDPFDATGPQFGDTLLDATAEITADAPRDVHAPGTAGQHVFFKSDYADPALSGVGCLILTVFRPDGTILQRQIVTRARSSSRRAPVTGDYKVRSRHVPGAMTASAQLIVGGTMVTTDYNLLFFDAQGTSSARRPTTTR